MNIVAVIMAAGASKRFGGKKLHSIIEGKKLYEIVIDKYAFIDNKLIVTGDNEIIEYAKKQGFDTVLNLDADKGASLTIKKAVDYVRKIKNVDGILFAVCDQPYLNKESINLLISKFNELKDNSKNIVLSSKNKLGNPTIIGSKYFDELSKLTGDVGGKVVINKYPQNIVKIEVKEKELFDIDYKDDLKN